MWNVKVGGMIECIADIEKLIPDAKQVIADFQAGNLTAAISEIETMVPIVQKALTDCQ